MKKLSKHWHQIGPVLGRRMQVRIEPVVLNLDRIDGFLFVLPFYAAFLANSGA